MRARRGIEERPMIFSRFIGGTFYGAALSFFVGMAAVGGTEQSKVVIEGVLTQQNGSRLSDALLDLQGRIGCFDVTVDLTQVERGEAYPDDFRVLIEGSHKLHIRIEAGTETLPSSHIVQRPDIGVYVEKFESDDERARISGAFLVEAGTGICSGGCVAFILTPASRSLCGPSGANVGRVVLN